MGNIKHTTKLTSKSIESSGLPSDYKKAIAEYIWNGFDANASLISIDFNTDFLGYLEDLSITDNGHGIDMHTISQTFGNFMESMKTNSFSDTGYIKGKKGKGRFSFFHFCNNATWNTSFKTKDDKILEYKIFINKTESQNFETNETIVSKKIGTGTKVIFRDFIELSAELIESEDFRIYLCNEFGWFLRLNKDNNYKILINGDELDYTEVIADIEEFEEQIEDKLFTVTFIRWEYKFGDKYYSYFLDSKKRERYRKPTSFNNKAIDFHHSIYAESEYFDNFKFSKENGYSLFDDISQYDDVFKTLIKKLTIYIADKEKKFVKELKAGELIKDYNTNKILPDFKENQYDQFRKADLETVIKEIYTVQPKIFQNLNNTQSKTIVGFLNLLLDTEQREDLLLIIDNVVKLSENDRTELATVLKRSHLTHITSLVKFLENRFNVIEVLKTLIYDLEKFTNERNHIQTVIENNYWLFGEQYHMVSADKNFETLLNNYLAFLEGNNRKPDIEKLNKKDKLRRPDIFICQKTEKLESNSDFVIEENIIVELKRPSVEIGKKQFSQIEDYLGFISNEDRYNSQLRQWKFILIGKSIDDHIKRLYKNQELRNKKFLVQAIDNYEIYIMTWDDLFRVFDIKHKHLIDKLEFNSSIIEELESKGIILSKEVSDQLTNNIS